MPSSPVKECREAKAQLCKADVKRVRVGEPRLLIVKQLQAMCPYLHSPGRHRTLPRTAASGMPAVHQPEEEKAEGVEYAALPIAGSRISAV